MHSTHSYPGRYRHIHSRYSNQPTQNIFTRTGPQNLENAIYPYAHITYLSIYPSIPANDVPSPPAAAAAKWHHPRPNSLSHPTPQDAALHPLPLVHPFPPHRQARPDFPLWHRLRLERCALLLLLECREERWDWTLWRLFRRWQGRRGICSSFGGGRGLGSWGSGGCWCRCRSRVRGWEAIGGWERS